MPDTIRDSNAVPQSAAPPHVRVLRLRDIAHARSGDKGNHANIGVIANTSAGFEFLGLFLTPQRVADWFAGLNPTHIERFEMPGICAWNFVLYNVLSGGASESLRVDTQGKTLAMSLLQMPLPDSVNRAGLSSIVLEEGCSK